MANLFSNMFASQTEEATRQWAISLTLEQIEDYERQGMDMSAYRLIREEHLAEKQRFIDENKAFLDFDKLEKYKRTPRSAEDSFINDVADFNGTSDKKKHLLETAPLVYGRVVQANTALYTPHKDDLGATAMVVLFALDDEHRYNIEWLDKTAKRISEIKDTVDSHEPQGILYTIIRLLSLHDSGFIKSHYESKKLDTAPSDCREFIKTLRDYQSSFCFPLGASISEGADAWCSTRHIPVPSYLPMSVLPYNRIIPLLISEPPKQYKATSLLSTVATLGKNVVDMIPPAYYSK